jgi:hypothetical protein
MADTNNTLNANTITVRRVMRLDADVVNPQSDRRRKYDVAVTSSWKKGGIYEVETTTVTVVINGKEYPGKPTHIIRMIRSGLTASNLSGHIASSRHHEAFAAIWPHLVEASPEERVAGALTHRDAHSVVRKLVEAGCLTWEKAANVLLKGEG